MCYLSCHQPLFGIYVVLYYPTLEKKTGKRGHPKWFDVDFDFANLDSLSCRRQYGGEQGKAIRIEGM